jgi:hypothetical protein
MLAVCHHCSALYFIAFSIRETSLKRTQMLASNQKLFNNWKIRAKVALMNAAPEDVLSQFDDLYRLEAMPSALQVQWYPFSVVACHPSTYN